MIRTIDANALQNAIIDEFNLTEVHDQYWWNRVKSIINNAPTVEYPFYQEAYQTGYEEGKNERPQGKWIGVVYSKNRIGVGMCNQCGVNRIKEI